MQTKIINFDVDRLESSIRQLDINSYYRVELKQNGPLHSYISILNGVNEYEEVMRINIFREDDGYSINIVKNYGFVWEELFDLSEREKFTTRKEVVDKAADIIDEFYAKYKADRMRR